MPAANATGGVVVLGSLNMDFVVAVPTLPAPGQTVLGSNFRMIPGGKGANQACAAARLSKNTPVRMIGRVGQDVFGDHLKASLAAAGVDVSAVHASRSHASGVAFIAVDSTGQNSIIVASGANMDLPAADVEAMRRVFHHARIALFQLESPLATVAAAMRMARAEGALTILDPAPAQPLTQEMLAEVDILTPNESEALTLLSMPVGRVQAEEARQIAARLRERGPRTVIVKLGEQGCFLDDGSKAVHIAGFAVEAVDTTAAGDIFNGALAIALAEQVPLEEAIWFANAAAAISVTRAGAQSSVPSRAEVDAFIGTRAK